MARGMRADKMSSLTTRRLVAITASFFPSLCAAAAWPNGPLVTSGRWITDATGAKVTYAGANWPGSLETMIPEGLQYQSIADIVSQMKSIGINAIRLTYAIEMIDQYYANGEVDIPIQTAFTDALGQENGTAIYNKVVANNPSFRSNTTRLEVYDAIAEECAKQEIYVHLDNHVSKAIWCCSPLDGNSWWNDTYFDVGNWTRGLSFMANRGKSWTSLTSMALRNELRPPLTSTEVAETYNWETWYKYMQQGASAIHNANPDTLIFLSGLDSDTNLTAVVQGTALTPGTQTFSFSDFAANKIVLELHEYDNIDGDPSESCNTTTSALSDGGADTVSSSTAKNVFPLVITEFGQPQTSSAASDPFITCVLDYFEAQHAGWMIWAITGSYYIRQGTQDYDEEWGLLSHDWSSWRQPDFINKVFVPAVNTTLAPITDDGPGNGTSSDGDGDSSASRLSNLGLGWAMGMLVVVGLIV
ncbi:glycoside hydrolase superfamily [Xylariaceae sp. FL0255]|nr:glycoside hydrolase superfamily [Xylariaceae sp. FL0255]